MDKDKLAEAETKQKLVVNNNDTSGDGAPRGSDLLNETASDNPLMPSDVSYQFGLTSDYGTTQGTDNTSKQSNPTSLKSSDSNPIAQDANPSSNNSSNPFGSDSNPFANDSSPFTKDSNSVSNDAGTVAPDSNPFGKNSNPFANDPNPFPDDANPVANPSSPSGRASQRANAKATRQQALVKMPNLKRRVDNKPSRPSGKKNKAGTYVLVTIAIFAIGIAMLVQIFAGMVTTPAPPEVQAFRDAKANADWNESKSQMRKAIDAAARIKLGRRWQISELSEFGEALSQHSEYKEALSVLDRGGALAHELSKPWYVYIVLQKAQCEHNLCLLDPNYKPHLRIVERAIPMASRVRETYRAAELTEMLALLNFDVGNDDAGNKNIARAQELFHAMDGYDWRERELVEKLWALRTHRMIEKVGNMPKPKTSVATAAAAGSPSLKQSALELLTNQKFADLTALFEKQESNRQVERSGREKIADLYNALGRVTSKSDQDWLDRLSLLQRWQKAEPNSPIPDMVLAEFYNKFAWKARSNAYAGKVKDTAWLPFKERLSLGQEQLNQALNTGSVKPEWFEIAQTNFLGGSLGDQSYPDYEKLVTTGIKFYPNYLPIYLRKTYYLQPRWHGKGPQWVEYITQEADRRGGSEGDKFYARMVNFVRGYYRDIYKQFPTITKSRVDKGNLLLDRDYPQSAAPQNDQ